MYVIFDRDYDHKWPSGAVSAFKKGWKGRVKREVAEAAIELKRARKGKPDDEAPEAVETLPGGLPAELAEPDALTPNRHVAESDDSQ